MRGRSLQVKLGAHHVGGLGVRHDALVTGVGLLIGAFGAVLGGCLPGSTEPQPPEAVEWTVADSAATHPTIAVGASDGRAFVAYTARSGDVTNVYLARLYNSSGNFGNARDFRNSGAFGKAAAIAEGGDFAGGVAFAERGAFGEGGAFAGGGDFGASARVNDREGDAASHQQAPAQVAVGPDGTVYVAWLTQTAVEGRRFPASDIRLARSTDGGRTFEPAITVNEDAGFPTSHHFHNLAVGPDGTVYVSWLDGSSRDRAAQSRARSGLAAAGHSKPSGDGGGHESHGHGEADLPGIEILVARSVDGGRSFEPGVLVAYGTCQCCRTALTVSKSGAVFVAWRQIFDGGTRDIALAHSTNRGKTFTTPARVHEDAWRIDGCPHSGPAVAVDASGVVHVAWYTGASGREGVYYSSSNDGGRTFTSSTALISNVPIAQVSAAPAGSQGGAWIAWEDPLRSVLHVLRVDGTTVDPTTAEILAGRAPTLAQRPEGNVVLWKDKTALRVRRLG